MHPVPRLAAWARAGSRWAAAGLALLGTACGGGASAPATTPPAPAPTCLQVGAFTTTGSIVPTVGVDALREISGICESGLAPGLLWVHDDDPVGLLHAVTPTGSVRAQATFAATLYDVEDLARGPGPVAGASYLYLADTGDNARARPFVRLLRIAEPEVPAGAGHVLPVSAEVFVLAYPDGAHDVEALVVDPADGTPYLLEEDPAGGDVFRVPMPLDPAWTESAPGTLVRVTSGRPLPPDVTAADAAPDGSRLFVRSCFSAVQLLRPAGQPFEACFTAVPCPFTAPGFGQYEALCVSASGDALWTTTELVLGSTVPLQRAPLLEAPTPP